MPGGRIWVVILWALAILAILILIGPSNVIAAYYSITPEAVKEFVFSFGMLAILVYLSLHAFRPFFFIPMTPLIVAAGFLFGLVNGFALAVIGSVIGALVLYWVSRYLFHDHVRDFLKGRFSSWNKKLENNSVIVIIILRVNPLIPFDGVGYWAGISNVSLRNYLIGTAIGIMPITFILTLLGASISEANSLTFYLSLVLTIAVLAVSEIYRRMTAK